MTDEELALELWAARCKVTVEWAQENFKDPDFAASWADVACRARELLATHALPADPPEGFVRVRGAVAVNSTGKWIFSGEMGQSESEMIEDAAWGLIGVACASFITADVPLPQRPAEIVARVEEPKG